MFRRLYCYAVCIAMVLLVLGYGFDIRVQAKYYVALQAEEKHTLTALLLQRQAAEKRMVKHSSRLDASGHQAMKGSGPLADIAMLAEFNHLDVQDIHLSHQANQLPLVVDGAFDDFIALIHALSRQPVSISMADFSIKPLRMGNLRMTMLLEFAAGADAPLVMIRPERKQQELSLFCGAHSLQVAENAPAADRQTFSLQQLKMSGYMFFQGRPHALLVLPNHVTIDAAIGDVVGREHATLVAIRANGCDFIQQQKKITLYMDEEKGRK